MTGGNDDNPNDDDGDTSVIGKRLGGPNLFQKASQTERKTDGEEDRQSTRQTGRVTERQTE